MKVVKSKLALLALAGGLSFSAGVRADTDLTQIPDDTSAQSDVQAYEDAFASDDAQTLDVNKHGRQKHQRMHARLLNKVRAVCASVQANDEQKTTIRDELLGYKAKALPLEAAIKATKVKYLQNVLSDSGSASEAATLVSEGIKSHSEVLQAKGDLVNKILFDILKPEQRTNGLKCMALIKVLKMERRVDQLRIGLD